jgi:ATP synthase protein I
MHSTERTRRLDPREAVDRDRSRMARRDPRNRSFWRSLNVLGMVGWPIVIALVSGTFLGRYLDERYGTGIRFTLMLMMVGLLIGCYTAWKSIAQKA